MQDTFSTFENFRNKLSDKIKRYMSFLLFRDHDKVFAFMMKGGFSQIMFNYLVVELTPVSV